ncbi:MAG: DUF2341 domain-containing protein, partial [Candidatus Micrarchaeota archaeon]|nr:DUF2341 domain-containing protein [Candidatus Micrarchaeota archaeon]
MLTDSKGSLVITVLNSIADNTFQDCGGNYNGTHEFCAFKVNVTAVDKRAFLDGELFGYIEKYAKGKKAGFQEVQQEIAFQYFDSERYFVKIGTNITINSSGTFESDILEEKTNLTLKTRKQFVKIFNATQISLKKGDTATLQFIFPRAISQDSRDDISISVLGASLTEYAWFNTTFTRKIRLSFNYSSTALPAQLDKAVFWLNDTARGYGNCQDWRFINNNETAVLPQYRLNFTNGSVCTWAVRQTEIVNSTGQTGWLYYANSSPVALVSNGNDVGLDFDEFNGALNTSKWVTMNQVCYVTTTGGVNNGTLTASGGVTARCKSTTNFTGNVSFIIFANYTPATDCGMTVVAGDQPPCGGAKIFGWQNITNVFLARATGDADTRVPQQNYSGFQLYKISVFNRSLGANSSHVNYSVNLNGNGTFNITAN